LLPFACGAGNLRRRVLKPATEEACLRGRPQMPC